jgi:hypothetical protein
MRHLLRLLVLMTVDKPFPEMWCHAAWYVSQLSEEYAASIIIIIIICNDDDR